MTMTTETEARFRVEERTPAHTTFRVFVGERGQGGSCGLLTMRNEEYDRLAPLWLSAPALLEALEAIMADCPTCFDQTCSKTSHYLMRQAIAAVKEVPR